MGGIGEMEFVGDDNVAAGDCWLETRHGSSDLRVLAMTESIRRFLTQGLDERSRLPESRRQLVELTSSPAGATGG